MEPHDFSGTDKLEPDHAAASLIELHRRKGLAARIVALERAYELRDEITGRFARRELDSELYAGYSGELTLQLPADLPNAKSIVIAAVPRPQTTAVFNVGGKQRTLVIPPTYTDYDAVLGSWTAWLDRTLRTRGHHAVAAALPYKLLATRSGLARYGRNNVTFVPGMGSFYELVAAFTDVPPDGGEWHEPRMLDRCARCRACVNRCPTKAIRLDRFLLESARCLVFHNERPGAMPFPDWIDPASHRTLIGCMECQSVCPENRDVKRWIGSSEEFTESETEMLLAGATAGDLPEATVRKLEHLDAVRFLGRMPRNLRAALA